MIVEFNHNQAYRWLKAHRECGAFVCVFFCSQEADRGAHLAWWASDYTTGANKQTGASHQKKTRKDKIHRCILWLNLITLLCLNYCRRYLRHIADHPFGKKSWTSRVQCLPKRVLWRLTESTGSLLSLHKFYWLMNPQWFNTKRSWQGFIQQGGMNSKSGGIRTQTSFKSRTKGRINTPSEYYKLSANES